jgi:hypothetical protein
MAVMSIDKLERFFRIAASLDVDKMDLRRFNHFIDKKTEDLLIVGEAAASANDRDIIEPWDLPITRGLQESIHAFRKLDEQLGLTPLLDQLGTRPQLDRDYSDDTLATLPGIIGGISLALARSFKIIDPQVKNPQAQHWERAYLVFDLLL